MLTDVPLKCTCGSVRGVVAASPKSGTRIVCYCEDCQAFARYLGAASALDAAGGTDIFQTAPANVRITAGFEAIRSLKLSPKGMVRWYTECCRTPVANTVSGSVAFVGLISTFTDHAGHGRSRDEALGSPFAWIHARAAHGPVPAKAEAAGSLRTMVPIFAKVIGWTLLGKAKPSPFFDPKTKAPRVAPHVLTTAERDALRP